MLELLARKKLAIQEGKTVFRDDELGREFDTSIFDPEVAAEVAWTYYTQTKPTIHKYTNADWRDCRQWMYDAMSFQDGQFNPLKRTILWPEKYFDFVIEEEWARYSFTTPEGKKLEGQLGLKGTIDLTCLIEGRPHMVELCDWKTGKRLDWATGQVKDIKKLRNDPQLRLYHYALSRLLPDIEQIVITIVYIADGGPFTLPPFTKKDLPETEAMVRKRFEEIRSVTRPKLNKSWKCTSFCHFGKNDYPGTNRTICDHINRELLALGMDRVIEKYGNANAFATYGDGGGRSGEKTGR